jgi:TRAP-type C4-dicarboxylate transport system permease small subunit
MRTFFKAVDGMQRGMKVAGAFCLLSMALVTGADIFGRAAFNSPIFGSEEIVSLLAVLAVSLSLPYAHKMQSHISVEIFIRRFSRKTRAAIMFAVDLVLLAFFSVICWRLLEYALDTLESEVVTMNLEIPKYLVIFALAFGFAAFVLSILAELLQAFAGSEDEE